MHSFILVVWQRDVKQRICFIPDLRTLVVYASLTYQYKLAGSVLPHTFAKVDSHDRLRQWLVYHSPSVSDATLFCLLCLASTVGNS